jgi:hypothetical protein
MKASLRLSKKLSNNYFVLVKLRPDNWSPRIDMIVRRKPIYDYEQCVKLEELINKFDDKWFNKISLDQYDLELDNESILNADTENDIKLNSSFIKRVTNSYMDKDYKVLYSNCECLVDKKS